MNTNSTHRKTGTILSEISRFIHRIGGLFADSIAAVFSILFFPETVIETGVQLQPAVVLMRTGNRSIQG